MRFFCLILSLFLSFLPLYSEEIDVSQPLHISELIPSSSGFITLAIEPAVPKNFTALCKGREVNYADHVYWGPKEVLEAFFKDPDSLSQPIFEVYAVEGQSQQTPGVLDEKFFQELVLKNPEFVSYHLAKWGSYPYCELLVHLKNEPTRILCVGLNQDHGVILGFKLLCPKTAQGKEAGLKLWNTFVQESKELPEPLFLKANGQEMHTGRTIIDVVGRKVEIIAEERKSDRKIRLAVIPSDQTVTFTFKNAKDVLFAGKWRNGDRMLKLDGAYIVDEGWVHLDTTSSIFIKEVDDFSPIPILRKNIFFRNFR